MRILRSAPFRIMLLCGILAGALGVAGAQGVQGRILKYHSDILVNTDASLNVLDTIVYRAQGPDPCSGIYRYFATDYPVEFPLRHVAHFDFQQVQRDGAAEPFNLSSKAHGVELQIGSQGQALVADKTYTYTISYHVQRIIDYYADHDEFYWHVTGGGWEFPIEQASATIRFATPVHQAEDLLKVNGGISGDPTASVKVATAPDGATTVTADGPLAPRHGLVFLLKFPASLVQAPSAEEERANMVQDNYTFCYGIATVVLVLLVYLVLWFGIGKHPKPGTIVAQATPPGAHSPAMLRYVRTMHYDPKTMAIILVNLAVKGLLRIQELEDRYILHRNDDDHPQSLRAAIAALAEDPATVLPVEESSVVNVMLSSAEQFMFSSVHSTQIHDANTRAKEQLLHHAEHRFFLNNYAFLAIGLILSSLGLLWLTLHEVPSEYPGEQFRLALGVLWINLGCPFFAYLAFYLWRDIFSFAVGRIGNGGLMFKYALGLLAFLLLGLILLWNSSPTLCCVLLALVVMHVVFAHLLRAPTRLGRKLLDEIEGFRHYLLHGHLDPGAAPSPEHTPELFARMLPYALALDAEEQWAAHFKAAIQTPGAVLSPAMDWYFGPAWQHRDPLQLAISLREEMAPSMTPITVPVDSVS